MHVEVHGVTVVWLLLRWLLAALAWLTALLARALLMVSMRAASATDDVSLLAPVLLPPAPRQDDGLAMDGRMEGLRG